MVVAELPLQDEVAYTRPAVLAETYTHYCPGCLHGVAHKLET
mgnify:CR=1 FL=1